MATFQPLPDACDPDLGHVVARANQAGSNGLSNDALLFRAKLDRHGAQTSCFLILCRIPPSAT
jgi:hypothetical protein